MERVLGDQRGHGDAAVLGPHVLVQTQRPAGSTRHQRASVPRFNGGRGVSRQERTEQERHAAEQDADASDVQHGVHIVR